MPQFTNAAGTAYTSANLPIADATVDTNDQPVTFTADLYLREQYGTGNDPAPGSRITLINLEDTVMTRNDLLRLIGRPLLYAAEVEATAAGGDELTLDGSNVNTADTCVFVSSADAETAAAEFTPTESGAVVTTPALTAGEYTVRLSVAGIDVDQPVTVTVA